MSHRVSSLWRKGALLSPMQTGKLPTGPFSMGCLRAGMDNACRGR